MISKVLILRLVATIVAAVMTVTPAGFIRSVGAFVVVTPNNKLSRSTRTTDGSSSSSSSAFNAGFFSTTKTTTKNVRLQSTSSSSSSPVDLTPISATSPDKVVVLDDASAVDHEIRRIVMDAAKTAIDERGHFALAIPGGSILKMLAGDDILVDGDWTSKTTIVYVNHKCVDMTDGELATHAKAKKIFMDQWVGVNPIVMDGTDDGPAEASSYQSKMEQLPQEVLPRDTNGLPIFDLALIGVGDDGHIGSLYPNRNEVLETSPDKWVLPVSMKDPPSITLSLPVMANARQVVVAACGVSDKYPQGKSAGMFRAIASNEETIQSFPAVGLRSVATWVLDKAAASKLGDRYGIISE